MKGLVILDYMSELLGSYPITMFFIFIMILSIILIYLDL